MSVSEAELHAYHLGILSTTPSVNNEPTRGKRSKRKSLAPDSKTEDTGSKKRKRGRKSGSDLDGSSWRVQFPLKNVKIIPLQCPTNGRPDLRLDQSSIFGSEKKDKKGKSKAKRKIDSSTLPPDSSFSPLKSGSTTKMADSTGPGVNGDEIKSSAPPSMSKGKKRKIVSEPTVSEASHSEDVNQLISSDPFGPPSDKDRQGGDDASPSNGLDGLPPSSPVFGTGIIDQATEKPKKKKEKKVKEKKEAKEKEEKEDTKGEKDKASGDSNTHSEDLSKTPKKKKDSTATTTPIDTQTPSTETKAKKTKKSKTGASSTPLESTSTPHPPPLTPAAVDNSLRSSIKKSKKSKKDLQSLSPLVPSSQALPDSQQIEMPSQIADTPTGRKEKKSKKDGPGSVSEKKKKEKVKEGVDDGAAIETPLAKKKSKKEKVGPSWVVSTPA